MRLFRQPAKQRQKQNSKYFESQIAYQRRAISSIQKEEEHLLRNKELSKDKQEMFVDFEHIIFLLRLNTHALCVCFACMMRTRPIL